MGPPPPLLPSRIMCALRFRLALALALCLLAGCAAGSGAVPAPDAGPGLDAGVPLDASPDAFMPLPDAAAPPDSGPASTDGGPPDAGTDAGPACACPNLPTSCTPPTVGAPFFTPDLDGRFGAQLMNVLACATTSVHAVFYETTWSCIVDDFVGALDANPTLTVELVIDNDRCPRDGTGRLTCPLARLDANPRATIVADDRSALMHDKFLVADGTRVWVGSANLTRTSFCTDINDSMVIEQPEIVAAYEAEFQRMYTDGQFGPRPVTAPVTGGPYRVYFGPQTPIDAPANWFTDLTSAISAATTSVDVLTNAWTRTEVSDALVAAVARGVSVRALVDDTYVDHAPAQALIAAGIPVRHGSFHAKIAVIDGHQVITGSANWSMNAWSNDEDSLWIDDATVGAAYTAEIDAAWSTATPP